jgi:hypothetical protein
MLRPLRIRESELQRDYRIQKRTWKAQHKSKDADGLGGEVDEPEEPERLLVSDITTEKLCEILILFHSSDPTG